MEKAILYKIFKYFLFFVLFLLLHYAKIEILHPFAFGMLFALIWCNQKIYIISPLYVLAGMISDFSLNSFIILLSTCFIFSFFYFLHYKFKKPLNSILIGLYAFLSQGVYLFLNSFDGQLFFRACVCVIVGIICLYAYLYFFQSLLVHGLRRKFMLDEVISFGVLCVVFGIGIVSLPGYQGMFSKFLLVLLCLVFSFVFVNGQSIAFSTLLGIGSLLATRDFEMFVLVCLFSIVLCLTKNSKKIFSCMSIVLIDIFANLYFFNYYNIYLFLPVLMAVLLVFLIPKKSLKKVQNYIISEQEEFGLRDMINKSRQKIFERLFEVNSVFKEMGQVYVSMNKKTIKPEDAVSFLFSNLTDCVCSNCRKKDLCPYYNLNSNTSEIQNLIALSLSRGRVSLVEVSPKLLSSCDKISLIINKINDSAKEYSDYAIINSSVSSSRYLIAEQLKGVREIISSVCEDIKKTITFDLSTESKIIEELMYEHIICSEAVVYLKGEKFEAISLIVKNEDVNSEKIIKISEKITKIKLEVKNCEPSQKSGYTLLELIPKMPYDILFGVAQMAKYGSEVSGDTFSVTRISGSKVFMSVCDGMGSGKEAYEISKTSLGLVEKFYEAGFDSNLIVQNVNKLLSLREEESFSALDVCVFDLEKCFCELIKIGATIGFIKQKDETILVETSALPLGILENAKPNFLSYSLNDNDMVLLLSDGVVDAWSDVLKLKNLINNIKTDNPQILADIVLEESLKQNKNYAEDDMTVLVCKIWQKI